MERSVPPPSAANGGRIGKLPCRGGRRVSGVDAPRRRSAIQVRSEIFVDGDKLKNTRDPTTIERTICLVVTMRLIYLILLAIREPITRNTNNVDAIDRAQRWTPGRSRDPSQRTPQANCRRGRRASRRGDGCGPRPATQGRPTGRRRLGRTQSGFDHRAGGNRTGPRF